MNPDPDPSLTVPLSGISGDLPIRQWVRPQVITISPECSIGELAQVLQAHRISGVPVVDHANRLVGVVSQTDIAQYLAQARGGESRQLIGYYDGTTVHSHLPDSVPDAPLEMGKVSEILTPFSHSVTPDTCLREVIRLMLEYRIHRLPVMQNETIVGVVTTMDVLRVFYDLLRLP